MKVGTKKSEVGPVQRLREIERESDTVKIKMYCEY